MRQSINVCLGEPWSRDAHDHATTNSILNPSVAEASRDDPTLRRCIGIAKSLGGGDVASDSSATSGRPACDVGPANESVARTPHSAVPCASPEVCPASHGPTRHVVTLCGQAVVWRPFSPHSTFPELPSLASGRRRSESR
ncbi:MAG: DUF1643 domain-containing protein [Gemmatimonadota bacterium]